MPLPLNIEIIPNINIEEKDSLTVSSRNNLQRSAAYLKVIELDSIRKAQDQIALNFLSSLDTIGDLLKFLLFLEKNPKEKEHYSNLLGKIPSIAPIRPEDQDFLGSRIHKKNLELIDPKNNKTPGVYFFSKKSVFVYATADGVVSLLKKTKKRDSGILLISHKYNYKTYFSHLSKILVKEVGQEIKQGEIIGIIGNSNRNFFFKYQVIKNRKYHDPKKYLSLGQSQRKK